jgi:hypothetical protein
MGKPIWPRGRKTHGEVWTIEEALDWYHRARARAGRRVTKRDMGDYYRAFARLFGSVSAFQAAGGDEPGRRGRPSKRREDEEVGAT